MENVDDLSHRIQDLKVKESAAELRRLAGDLKAQLQELGLLTEKAKRGILNAFRVAERIELLEALPYGEEFMDRKAWLELVAEQLPMERPAERIDRIIGE